MTTPGVNKTSMVYFPPSIHTRRQFLARSSALSLSALIASRLNAQSIRSAHPAFNDLELATIPRDTLLKFTADGSPRRFAGNTVVCHVPPQSRFLDAVVAFGHALRSSSFGSKLAGLPDDSYHATILGGPNDQDRMKYGWPSDIPIRTSIAECNRIIQERMVQFRTHTELPLRFRLDKQKTLAQQLACGLQLVPADASEELKIRMLRDRMSDEVFRYREANHDIFGFHISMAYQLRGFTGEERQKYQDLLAQHVTTIEAATSIIELGVPEFCTFEDMYRFEVRTLLRT
jgi:hypothetical protein